MGYKEVDGNLFNSDAMALVNTVNCVGVMGKGIALEFRRRFPQMFEEYRQDCLKNKLVPGRIYSYQIGDRIILNFAIKGHWKHPSTIGWVESCLKQFAAGYETKGITSVAFPWMGAMNGRIPFDIIRSTMRKHLEPLEGIQIEVYTFDPAAPDPLFDELKKIVHSGDLKICQKNSQIQENIFYQIIEAVREGEVRGMSQLSEIPNVGKISVDKLYEFLSSQLKALRVNDDINIHSQGDQLRLFDND